MNFLSFIFLLIGFNFYHVESNVIRCFPIEINVTNTENSTQTTNSNANSVQSTIDPTTHISTSQTNTDSTTQSIFNTNTTLQLTNSSFVDNSTQSTTSQITTSSPADLTTPATNSTSNPYSELLNNISELNSQIAIHEEYIRGNETAVNETIANITAINSNILANSSTTEDVAKTLLNINEIIQNNSTTSGSARKKRETSSKSTPCSDAQALSQNVQSDIDNGNAKIETVSNTIDKLKSCQSSLKVSASQYPNIGLDLVVSNVENLNKQYSNTVETQKTTNALKNEQLLNFGPIKDKICSLNLGPCGTFTPYNPITDPNAPINKAFSAGTYLDGTQAYVGVANLTDPFDIKEKFVPGRCTTSAKIEGPGVYVMSFFETRETDQVAYLQNHYELDWVLTDKDNAATVQNAIKIKGDDNSNGYLIGRYNLTYMTSTNSCNEYTQVAKVYIDNGRNDLLYADLNQFGQTADSAFEVLTCKPINVKSNWYLFKFDNFIFIKKEDKYVQETTTTHPFTLVKVNSGVVDNASGETTKYNDFAAQLLVVVPT